MPVKLIYHCLLVFMINYIYSFIYLFWGARYVAFCPRTLSQNSVTLYLLYSPSHQSHTHISTSHPQDAWDIIVAPFHAKHIFEQTPVVNIRRASTTSSGSANTTTSSNGNGNKNTKSNSTFYVSVE